MPWISESAVDGVEQNKTYKNLCLAERTLTPRIEQPWLTERLHLRHVTYITVKCVCACVCMCVGNNYELTTTPRCN